LTVEPVLTPAEAVENEQFTARDVVQDGDHPRVGFPAVCDRPEGDERVPDHGEHTGTLLSGAGLSEERIEELRESGVLR
jgi:crotonobetainyl-CoA:carnitine CoA-transferase CaiB-like acyl-CoA transferase